VSGLSLVFEALTVIPENKVSVTRHNAYLIFVLKPKNVTRGLGCHSATAVKRFAIHFREGIWLLVNLI